MQKLYTNPTNPELTTANLAILRETYIAKEQLQLLQKYSELEDVKLNLKEAGSASTEAVTDKLSNPT
ncbi:MAG: hypothetical protein MRQ09_06225 [Candidatus Midichloria sp.]|nr:hypothetical protein [Candidatus Midichloria sp.]